MCDLTVSEPAEHLHSHRRERAAEPILNDARATTGVSKSRAGVHRSIRQRWCLPGMAAEWICALSLLILPVGAGTAQAHAFLDHADPRVGNTVKSPRVISLWFTQNLESAFSTIEVLDSNGARVNVGKASVDAGDRKLLRVPVRALPAGTYTVKWHVLSVDTHTTEGNFTFHVSP